MYKNLKSNNKFAEGNRTTSRLFSVINGLVPLILVQRVTNSVNKFAILLHKYRFSQDCRNRLCVMSGNDGYCGFGHSVCYQFFKRMYHPGSSANELALKAKDDYNSVLQLGRSMIEMLGVLAIVAVLSVGGIAGYSKAMEKFKVNKLISEYNMLIFGLMEHKQSILLPDDDNIDFELGETIKALNLVPENWRLLNEKYLDDGRGNLVNARIGQSSVAPVLVIDFNLGGLSEDESGSLISTTFSNKLCFEMFNTLVYPLRDGLVMGRVFRTGNKEDNRYYGAAYCGGGNKCLQDLNLSDIKRECDACDGKNRCNVTITF